MSRTTLAEYLAAQQLADTAHKGQTRRNGTTPYIVHPKNVVKVCRSLYGKSFLRQSVAILHDVLEDTDYTADDMRKLGISDEIIFAVELLTYRPGQQSYDEYISQIKHSILAVEVKIADMIANLSDTPTMKQVRKYSKAIVELQACLPS